MQQRHLLGFLFFLLLIFQSANACTIIDDENHSITLHHPAQRIISLAPDLTELLFAAGAGDHIIGVIRGSDYPAQVRKISIVANYNQIDVEHIAALRPDLIVVWAESHIPEQLRNLGIPIYLSHQRKLQDIPLTLQRFGCLAGTQKTANTAAHLFLQKYHSLQKKYEQQKPISVFYQVWSEPLITITQASWINEIITLCGGNNVFAHLPGTSPEINKEAVIRANPHVIISNQANQDWKKQWREWPELFAVQKNYLFFIDPDLIERAGPRILAGADRLCRILGNVHVPRCSSVASSKSIELK